MLDIFKGSILAGVCISVGCVVFLKVGGVAGAVLFAFGLLACVHFKLPLYTGTAGFVMNRADMAKLGVILLGNIAGCLLMAVAMDYAQPADIPSAAAAVTEKRTQLAMGQVVVLGTLCGFLMTTAVKFGREGRFLPLLFAVPVFILCGFIHSIADAFYIAATPSAHISVTTIINYLCAVIGNFIGCNLYRIIYTRLSY